MGVITIGTKDFVRGVSTSNDIPDSGYSPKNTGQNLLANIGTMNGQPTVTLKTGLDASEDVVASLYQKYNATVDGYLATAGGDLYTVDFGANVTKVQSGMVGLAHNITDMVIFDNDIYVTGGQDISKNVAGGGGSIDIDWWTGTVVSGGVEQAALSNGNVHPLLVLKERLYIGDGPKLHSWDGTTVALDLLPLNDNEPITALGRYTANGEMLLGVGGDYPTGEGNAEYKLIVWDTNSELRNLDIPVPEKVTAIFNSAGVTYIVMGRTLGYLNGSGVTPLRYLNTNFSNASVVTKQKITEVDNVIYIAEVDDILAYGSLYQGGNKIFFYPYTTAGTQIHTIGKFYNDPSGNKSYLALCYTSGTAVRFGYFDVRDDSGTGTTCYSNKIYLPSNSRINKVEVNTDVLASGDIVNFEILKSSTDSTVGIGSMDFSVDGAITQKTLARNKKIETNIIQAALAWSAGNTKIRQIKVYYEPIEKPI